MRSSADTAGPFGGSASPRRAELAAHPLGVISVVLAGAALVVAALGVAMVGAASASLESIYGRRLVDLPFAELPPSIGVYVVVLGLAGLAWIAAIVLAVTAMLRHRCIVCGSLALALSAVTPALALLLWLLTSTPGV